MSIFLDIIVTIQLLVRYGLVP